MNICERTFDEYKQQIWQPTSILVLCSHTVKEPVPVIAECTKHHSIILHYYDTHYVKLSG